MPRSVLCLLESRVEEWCAKFVRLYLGEVDGAELGCVLGNPKVVPAQDDLDARAEALPAADGIALDSPGVALKRLRQSEDGQREVLVYPGSPLS